MSTPNPQRLKETDSRLGRLVRASVDAPDTAAPYAQARAWQGVQSRLQQRTSPFRLALAGGLAIAAGALLVLGVWQLVAPTTRSTMLLASAEARWLDANAQPVAAQQNFSWNQVTTRAQPVVVEQPGVRLAAMGDTVVQQTSAHAATLQQGTLGLIAREPFTVTHGAESVELAQATAALTVSADGQLMILVDEGSVMARVPAPKTLRAGERWPATVEPVAVLPEAVQLVKTLQWPPVKRSGVAAVPAAAPVLSAGESAQLIEQAREQQRRGQSEAAVATYGRAAPSEGLHGEIALYERARIRQRDLHDATGALSDLDTCQRRFAHGGLAAEVALSRMEVLLQLHRTDEALTQMNAFLESFSTSERVAEVHLMRGEVLRGRGACAQAVADFELARRDPRWADDATWYTALCDGSREAVESYLKAFAQGAHRAEASALIAH